MAAKYPLNGRGTTIYDLIIDYAETSTWPTDISEKIGDNIYYKLFDINNKQPFNKLVLLQDRETINNEDIIPYDVVWFDTDIYSNTKYDKNNNRYLLIQTSDTSIFKHNKHISINEFKHSEKDYFEKYGFRFRFIIPFLKNTDNPFLQKLDIMYYYNYKMDNGQSAVIYSLQKIIDTCKEYKKDYINLLFNNSDNNTVTPIFDTSIIILNKDNNNLITYQYLVQNTTDTSITSIPIILNTDLVNPNIYDFLGDYDWTHKNVKYPNYTTFTSNTINNLTVVDYVKLLQPNINTEYINEIYTNVTNYVNDNSNNTDNPLKYNYYTASFKTKLYYYILMFLVTLRHFDSYITSCAYIKKSNIIYSLNQNILRCDIDLQHFIENITIIDAIHEPYTALIPGKLNETTKIALLITYQIKYRNIIQLTESSFELIIQLSDIKNWTNSENNGETPLWQQYRLSYPGYNEIEYNHVIDNTPTYYKYGSTEWPEITTDYTSSLNTLKWPYQDNSLDVKTEERFNLAKNNYEFKYKDKSAYVDTNDITLSIYNNLSNKEDVKAWIQSNNLTFFGILRIHNTYKDITRYTNTESSENQEILNSSYYLDVSILRLKNYYYTTEYISGQENTDIADDSELNMYYEPLYNFDNDIIIPKAQINNLYVKGDILEPTINNELYNKLFPITVEYNNPIYITLQAEKGLITYYASDSYEIEYTDFEYTNEPSLILYKYNNTSYIWENTSKYTIRKPNLTTNNSNVFKTCYILTLLDDELDSEINTNNLYKLKISSANNYYYFIATKYKETSNKINVHYLIPNYIEESNIAFIIYKNINTLSDNNLTYQQLYNYNRESLSNATINIIDNTNILFKPTSVKYINRNATVLSTYKYDLNYVYIVYESSGNPVYKFDTKYNSDFNISDYKNNGNLFVSLYPLLVIKVIDYNLDNFNFVKFYTFTNNYELAVEINEYVYLTQINNDRLYIVSVNLNLPLILNEAGYYYRIYFKNDSFSGYTGNIQTKITETGTFGDYNYGQHIVLTENNLYYIEIKKG